MRTPVAVIIIVILVVSAGAIYWTDIAHQESANSGASYLVVGLRLNATVIHPGQRVAFDYWVNNTSREEVNVTSQDGWALPGLKPWGCVGPSWPLRFGFVKGNYAVSNISAATFMPLNQTLFNCSSIFFWSIKSVSFKPSSSQGELSFDNGGSFPFYSNSTESIPGWPYLSRLTPGQYTIVAGDEWGHLATAAFLVTS